MALSTASYDAEWAAETVWASGLIDVNIFSFEGGVWVDCFCPDYE